ncbi:hypothetical protein LXL04_018221 [Taraxacum kok-saghyz]
MAGSHDSGEHTFPAAARSNRRDQFRLLCLTTRSEQHSSIQPVPNLPYSESLPLRRTSSSPRRPWQFTTLEKKEGRFESVAHLYLDSRSCGLVSSSPDEAWHRWVFGVTPGNKLRKRRFRTGHSKSTDRSFELEDEKFEHEETKDFVEIDSEYFKRRPILQFKEYALPVPLELLMLPLNTSICRGCFPEVRIGRRDN